MNTKHDINQPVQQIESAKKTRLINKRNLILIGMIVIISVVLIVILNLILNSPKSKLNNTDITRSADVSLTSKGFEPQTIQIIKGTQVTWTNIDDSEHEVAIDPHPSHTSTIEFEFSPQLSKNETYSYNFTESGTFNFHDESNPTEFHGTVIVIENTTN